MNTKVLLALVTALSIPSVALAAPKDGELGRMRLPQGKYVLTHTDSGNSMVITIDEKGNVNPLKAAAPVQPAKTAAPPAVSAGAHAPTTATAGGQPTAAPGAAVVPGSVPGQPGAVAGQPGAVAGQPGAPATAASPDTKAYLTNKIKKEAERAIRRGDVQKLIKKVGL